MKLFGSVDRGAERPAPGSAIRLENPRANLTHTPWGSILVIFMRLLACLWICQGLAAWARVLLPDQTLFATLPGATSAAVIFFAIADLVAGVGLWLATPWGGALWLFAASSQIFVAIAIKNSISLVWIGLDVFLIAIYFFLTYKAGEVREP
ncbi:MAG TPA: hypothetical protein VKV77_03975 [Methylovirgula sp.]|nr:hypothetical protein [Methylovirgula sp.]